MKSYLIIRTILSLTLLIPAVCDVIDTIKNRKWHRVNKNIFVPWGKNFLSVFDEVHGLISDIKEVSGNAGNVENVIHQIKNALNLNEIKGFRKDFYNTSISKFFQEDINGYLRHKQCQPFIYRKIEFKNKRNKKKFLKDINAMKFIKSIDEHEIYVKDNEEKPKNVYKFHFLLNPEENASQEFQLDNKITTYEGNIIDKNSYLKFKSHLT